ncbi:MAG TPA: hypothetical protein VGV14_02710 [Rhodanobacter sp.]|nr:hypothetical protein [Rhodanobacter sp.]
MDIEFAAADAWGLRCLLHLIFIDSHNCSVGIAMNTLLLRPSPFLLTVTCHLFRKLTIGWAAGGGVVSVCMQRNTRGDEG